MKPTTSPEISPQVHIHIEASGGLGALHLAEIWEYRELLYFLVLRDVKARYKQTALGIAWVALSPLLTTVIFTVIFGMFVKVPSDGLPYGLFALAGLIPWNFFSAALNRASNSLVGSANLITKVYFPRLLIPLAGVLSGLVDIVITTTALVLVTLLYGYGLSWTMLTLPIFVLLAVLATFAFGLFLAAVNVRFRDAAFLVPFLIQALFFVTPVIYSTTTFPENLRWLFAFNPMAAVVNGFRWACFGQPAVDWWLVGLSFAFSLAALVGALWFFRRMERTFADII